MCVASGPGLTKGRTNERAANDVRPLNFQLKFGLEIGVIRTKNEPMSGWNVSLGANVCPLATVSQRPGPSSPAV